MKKVYLIILALVVLIAAAAWWLFSNAFNQANYSNELADYLSRAVANGTLSAEYEGETHYIDATVVDGLMRVLRRGASEIQDVKAPPEEYDGIVKLNIDNMILTVYRENKNVDRVIMRREVGNRSSCTALEGYEMFKWVLHATGFEESE